MQAQGTQARDQREMRLSGGCVVGTPTIWLCFKESTGAHMVNECTKHRATAIITVIRSASVISLILAIVTGA